jgi:hypothetical protein
MSRNRKRGNPNETDPFAAQPTSLTMEEADALSLGAPPIMKTKSLQFKDNGKISFRRFQLTQVGFEPPADANAEEWQQLADMLFRLDGALQWMIGDFLLHETAWGDTARIAAEFGYEVGTLYDYKKVAKNVQIGVRTPNLSFGHHKLVKSMDEADQRKWLQRAEQNGWSVAEMRRQIRAKKPLKQLDHSAQIASRFRSSIDSFDSEIDNADQDELQQIMDILQQKLERVRSRLDVRGHPDRITVTSE